MASSVTPSLRITSRISGSRTNLTNPALSVAAHTMNLLGCAGAG
ncbi:MAG TPA: hypothetical protein VFE12_08940 [Acetobacteraceae bacterium]|jgi:hypothetical protein|nr:hypothetical protein [Acetobacteraceae bacterium]